MSKTDRSVVRNQSYQKKAISIRERHNERKNESYSNPDIVKDRSCLNIHFKQCEGTYAQAFDKMLADGIISTRGLKQDAKVFDELVFDVNTAYFERNGGYDYARKFFEETYRLAVKEAGGEQYILSAVMHADERNKSLSDQLGCDVFHYHLHVVYIPVVDKAIKWSKRCKDKNLVGTTREVIHQVSHSKKWSSEKALDEHGQVIRREDGKPVLISSYSLLQDRFFEHMQAADYRDFQRGERGSTAEHLNVLNYKIRQDRERVDALGEQTDALSGAMQEKAMESATLDKQVGAKQQRLSTLDGKIALTKQAAGTFGEIDRMAKKTIGGNLQLSPGDWERVSGLAKKGVITDASITDFKEQLATAQKDARIYRSRWEQLFVETKDLREAVKRAPQRVKEFLADVFRKPPEQRKAARSPERRPKGQELE